MEKDYGKLTADFMHVCRDFFKTNDIDAAEGYQILQKTLVSNFEIAVEVIAVKAFIKAVEAQQNAKSAQELILDPKILTRGH